MVPDAERILREEDEHQLELLRFLDEERPRYTGSIVLGLNDALVELTGALAGFTFALQNTKPIALTGSITGIAAALSVSFWESRCEVRPMGWCVRGPKQAHTACRQEP